VVLIKFNLLLIQRNYELSELEEAVVKSEQASLVLDLKEFDP
jgi:hypothetical protein